MKNKSSFRIKLFSFGLCFLIFFLLLNNLILRFNEQQFYQRMAAVVSNASEPSEIILALKEPSQESISSGISILKSYGYYGDLFTWQERSFLLILTGLAGCILFTFCIGLLLYQRKLTQRRIHQITDYLKQINAGEYPLHPYETEDLFSLLEDEIYKTVTTLRESRREAISTKENLAKNMADISHQLKTPLTSLSLITELLYQHMKNPNDRQIAEQILTQTDHLRTLVIALLNLSRMDAGVLQLKQKEIPVEELISCAAEPVLPLLKEKQQTFQMQGDFECSLLCDIGWTAEGIGNILKNCCEHTPEQRSIFVTIFQNPIYTEIRIEDEGEGFEPTELAHIFDRFYKGKHSAKSSIGIGLALAKSIMERQNGEVLAENRIEGGARFRIKFYKI